MLTNEEAEKLLDGYMLLAGLMHSEQDITRFAKEFSLFEEIEHQLDKFFETGGVTND